MDAVCMKRLPVNGKSDRSTLPSLTGLRFVAAFLVLFAHGIHVVCKTSTTEFFHLLGLTLAYLGMTVFFVLSGFVIHYNYGGQFLTRPLSESLRSFAVARFARLYPMYLVTFLLCVANCHLISSFVPEYYVYSLHLSMTQSWLYLVTHSKGWNHTTTAFFSHGWSISTEIFFYGLYPLLLLPINRLRQPRSVLTATITFVALAFGLLFVASKLPDFLIRVGWLEQWCSDSRNSFLGWLSYLSPPIRFLEFCLGCLAAQLYLSLREHPTSAREQTTGFVCLLLAGVSLLILLCVSFPTPADGYLSFVKCNFLFAPSCAALTFCLVRYNTALSRFLNRSPIVLLGEASYSIYLLQHFLWDPLLSPAPRPICFSALLDWTLKLTLIIGLVFVTSLGTYQYVEVPARNWLRRMLGSPSLASHPSSWSSFKIVVTILLIPALFLWLGYSLYAKHQLPLVYCARANTRLAQGDVSGAVADVEQAIRHNPNYGPALLERARLLQRQQEHGEAIRSFSAILAKSPKNVAALHGRAEAYQSVQRWSEALADYNCAIQLVPTYPNHYYLRALVYKHFGQIDNALADCSRALQFNVNHGDAYQLRAQLRQSLGDELGASSDYEEAVRSNPNLVGALLSRIREKQETRPGASHK